MHFTCAVFREGCATPACTRGDAVSLYRILILVYFVLFSTPLCVCWWYAFVTHVLGLVIGKVAWAGVRRVHVGDGKRSGGPYGPRRSVSKPGKTW